MPSLFKIGDVVQFNTPELGVPWLALTKGAKYTVIDHAPKVYFPEANYEAPELLTVLGDNGKKITLHSCRFSNVT